MIRVAVGFGGNGLRHAGRISAKVLADAGNLGWACVVCWPKGQHYGAPTKRRRCRQAVVLAFRRARGAAGKPGRCRQAVVLASRRARGAPDK